MDQGADALLQAAGEGASPDEELSDVDVDGDGSSSLSDIEDKDAEQDEDQEGSDDLSNISDDENDSEAETERLEESPNKFRPHQDVVLSTHNDTQRTPSKLQNQIIPDDQDGEEDEDPSSDAEASLNDPESPKSFVHDEAELDPPTAPTSLEDGPIENKSLLSVIDADTRKRKRSIMAGSGLEDDLEEPLRKRTGSVMGTGDEYAIEEDVQQDEEVDTSHPISGNISADEGGVAQEDEASEEIEEEGVADDEAPEAPEAVDIPVSPKRRGRKKKKAAENGVGNHNEDADVVPDAEVVNGDDDVRKAEDENAENEGDDEADAAQKNEEERKLLGNWLLGWDADSTLVEKKRIALDQLSSIERQFSTFRDR